MPLEAFLVCLRMMKVDGLDLDEVQCLLANLIYMVHIYNNGLIYMVYIYCIITKKTDAVDKKRQCYPL